MKKSKRVDSNTARNPYSLPGFACCADDALFLTQGARKLAIAFFISLAFALLVFVSSYITHSASLLAKFLHNLGDVLSIGIAWALERFSRKGPNDKYTYGYRRFSVMGAFFIALLLIYTSLSILNSNIMELFFPGMIPHEHHHHGHTHLELQAKGMILVAIFGLLAKGSMTLYLWRSKSLNERAVMTHMLLDALSWLLVLLTALVMFYAELPLLDAILSCFLALQILYFAVKILLQSVRILAQGVPVSFASKAVQRTILETVGVCQIDDFHMWSIDGGQQILTAKVYYDPAICPDAEAVEALLEEIRYRLGEYAVSEATLEPVSARLTPSSEK